MSKQLKFFQAIHEATDLCLADDPAVYVMGLGATDPKGTFGTTLGLQEKYGPNRVMDMPTSENGMTGIAIGSALAGMRPIMVHQRLDFALLSLEQIVNQAAKWHYMFGGKASVPLVLRMIVGRGWGQGPQHSQSLHAWFAHVPGLKVVMPSTPHDAKGLLIASIEDNNPVIFIEHRWLHNTFGQVPQGAFKVPLGKAQVARAGVDLTVVAAGFMVVESLRAAHALSRLGVELEVIDVRTLRPLDDDAIVDSVRKTGRLLAVDEGWRLCGFAGEVLALVAERTFDRLKCAPRRLTASDCPVPSSPALAAKCYPGAAEIIAAAGSMLRLADSDVHAVLPARLAPSDVPDLSFSGPF